MAKSLKWFPNFDREIEFDFDEILDKFRNDEKPTDKGGLLTLLIKQLTDVNHGAKIGNIKE